jgi:hypothetical protein
MIDIAVKAAMGFLVWMLFEAATGAQNVLMNTGVGY